MKWTLVSILTLMLGGLAVSADEVHAEYKSLKDATHIDFSGRDEWRYNLSRTANEIAVQFIGLKPDDLDGLDELKDKRVKKVSVTEGINGDALVKFSLQPGLNLFDYQTDSPVHLVFDIFKDEKKKAEAPKSKKKKPVAKSDLIVPKRNLASVDHPEIGEQPLLNANISSDPSLKLQNGIFDGNDQNMNRFRIAPGESISRDRALVKSEHSVFVHFPALALSRPFLKNVLDDGAMKYEIPEGSTDRELQIKLLVKLFSEQKYALVLRTLKFFREKYPTSPQGSTEAKLLDFLVADTYFKLWQRDHEKADFDTAMARYKDLLNKYPNDPSTQHTLVFIGANYLDTKNYFGALATFQVGIEKYKDSPFIWEMRLAQAEILNKLNKPEAALAELEKLQNDPKSGSFSTEAQLRRGDVFFAQKNYNAAIDEYKAAMLKFPERLSDTPHLYFNTAESKFWLRDYQGALDSYREFLQKFPSHPYGAYAMTRIGEIFDLLGIDQKRVTSTYLESYYRYRQEPGAFIAKFYINMSRYPQMKLTEVDAVSKEINEDLDRFKDISDLDPFVTLNLSKAKTKRGEFHSALETLTAYYKKNIVSPYLPIFKEYIIQTVVDEMTHNLNDSKNIKTIEEFLANQDSWFKGGNRVDVPFILGQAYENLNLAQDALQSYSTALNRLKSLGSEGLKAAEILEHLPTQDEINLRLAATSLKGEDLKKTSHYISEIKSPQQLSDQGQVERALILASLAEKEERTDLAQLSLKDLTEHWKGQDELLADAWLRLGHLEVKTGKYSNALPWVEKILTSAHGGKIKDETLRSALELDGDIRTNLGQEKKAIESYKEFLTKFGSASSSAAVKYKLGKIYYDKKDFRTAKEVWAGLKNDEAGKVWARMADENLAQANWDSKYGRYLREPASAQGGAK